MSRRSEPSWKAVGYAPPSPQYVKRGVMLRYGIASGVWIESGTFRGATTEFLANSASHVYSIEPSAKLARQAQKRFKPNQKVTIIEGLSEDILPDLLKDQHGKVSFWLDGHWSGGTTFKGPKDTPIREELLAIEQNLDHLEKITVLIDDVRCFDPANPEYSEYPTRSYLVAWADTNHLSWTIEQDIFVAWN